MRTSKPQIDSASQNEEKAISNRMYRSDDENTVNLLAAAATDEVLVAAAKRGDRPAFEELWRRYSSSTFRLVYRITKNQDDAEDVVQDAWMKAYVHLETFNGNSRFSTWLTRIAINSALMILRRKRAHPENAMELTDGETWQQWEIADRSQDIEREYEQHCRAERIRQAISGLRPSLRSVVEIYHFNEISVHETANIAGISIAAAKSRLLRARAILRKALT
jgi:RNA polymerase sigma-70 factor (ECF subfamily)